METLERVGRGRRGIEYFLGWLEHLATTLVPRNTNNAALGARKTKKFVLKMELPIKGGARGDVRSSSACSKAMSVGCMYTLYT